MKIAPQATTAFQKEDVPVLPLLPEEKTYGKKDVMSFKLRTDPADADSATYELTVPYLTGT